MRSWNAAVTIGRPGFARDCWNARAVATRLVSWALAAHVLGLDAADEDSRFVARAVTLHGRFLRENLELDIRANHLLRDAAGLVAAHELVGAWPEALRLLEAQLAEQVLADGCHYQRAPHAGPEGDWQVRAGAHREQRRHGPRPRGGARSALAARRAGPEERRHGAWFRGHPPVCYVPSERVLIATLPPVADASRPANAAIRALDDRILGARGLTVVGYAEGQLGSRLVALGRFWKRRSARSTGQPLGEPSPRRSRAKWPERSRGVGGSRRSRVVAVGRRRGAREDHLGRRRPGRTGLGGLHRSARRRPEGQCHRPRSLDLPPPRGVDVRRRAKARSDSVRDAGPVWTVHPRSRHRETIQQGRGNCSNLAFGLAYELDRRGID